MLELGRRRRRWWLAPVGAVLFLIIFFALAMPRVQSVQPAAGATGVPAEKPLRISFSRPMDRESVEVRFSVSPKVEGELRWQSSTLVYSPSEGWPLGERISVRMRAGARSSLFLPMLRDQAWSFEVAQRRITYLREDGPAITLNAKAPGAPSEGIVPEVEGDVAAYDWSPEGGLALLISRPEEGTVLWYRPPAEAEGHEVHECPADVRCGLLTISPGGSWLAWQQQEMGRSESGALSPGAISVWALSLEDGGAEQVGAGPGDRHSPHWVQRGRLAYYDPARGALLVVARIGTNWQELAAINQTLGEHWTWSPDGRFVVFPEVVFLDEGSASEFYSHLYRVEIETGLRTDLSQDSAELVEDASPSYSPDGLWLAFARKSLRPEDWTPGRQLWLMRADGSDAQALTEAADYNHSEITWRADSGALAYLRFEKRAGQDAREIWWYDLEAQQSELLVEGGYAPQWMP